MKYTSIYTHACSLHFLLHILKKIKKSCPHTFFSPLHPPPPFPSPSPSPQEDIGKPRRMKGEEDDTLGMRPKSARRLGTIEEGTDEYVTALALLQAEGMGGPGRIGPSMTFSSNFLAVIFYFCNR